MPNVKRAFVFTAAVLILAAATSLTLYYRHVTSSSLIRDAEADSRSLAHELVRSLSPALQKFLVNEADTSSGRSPPALPGPLRKLITHLLSRASVDKIVIYDRFGTVVYSSKPGEIGSNRAHARGVQEALAGRVASGLQLRDTWSELNPSTNEANIVHTYVPLSFPGEARAVGAFEIHSNAARLVQALEAATLEVLLGGLVGFSLLAAGIFFAFRRIGAQMELQQRAVDHERRSLSSASLRVLRSEEAVRQTIATNLEREVVQSLSAVKLSIESAIAKAAKDNQAAANPALQSVIPVMQEVIAGLNALAARLHPASVVDLGLLPAFRRVCDAFGREHDSIEVECAIAVEEGDVPQHLKITVYRTVEAVLEHLGREGGRSRVEVALGMERGQLSLRVEQSARAGESGLSVASGGQSGVALDVDQAMQRVVLAGGSVSMRPRRGGGIMFRADWPIQDEDLNLERRAS
jgi:signal transduction histidine kinase